MDPKIQMESLTPEASTYKSIYRQRISKFNKLHILYFFLTLSIATLQFIAIAFFSKGFLLARPVLSAISDLKLPTSSKFNKVIILLVDALRFDFTIPVGDEERIYHNNIKILYDTFSKQDSSSSLLLKFLADPPTTTMQRLKGLTTGSLPTFLDVGSNFDSSIITEDNLIAQMFNSSTFNNIFFAGDDTWSNLFNPYLHPQSKPYDSLNVWDLDTVDNGVISYFDEHLINPTSKNAKKDWDVLIGHMLGIDHVGHKYGPAHFTMMEKQKQVNKFITNIINSITDENTLLVVMGDHGMDHTGNHGGDSQDELESALFMYTKKKNFFNKGSDDIYNISNFGENYRAINQIDLVPTLSLLMNLPIPFNNLGWPIEEISKDRNELIENSNLVIKQLWEYKLNNHIVSNDYERELKIEKLYKSSFNNPELAVEFQSEFLDLCKDMWSRFDYYSIVTGITLLTFSLILLVILTQLVPTIVINKLIYDFIPLIFCLIFVSNFSIHGIFYVFQAPQFLSNFIWKSLLATSIGIILGIFIPLLDHYSIKWFFVTSFEFLKDYWTRSSIVFVILHATLFASNSFTIWEDKIVSFILSTFALLLLFEFFFLPKRQSTTALLINHASNAIKESTEKDENDELELSRISSTSSNKLPLNKEDRVMGIYHSIVFLLVTRLASSITICREEQGNYCTPTFNTISNYSSITMTMLFLSVFIFPSLLKSYFSLSTSFQGSAIYWVNTFLKMFLLVNFVYWFLTMLQIKNIDFLSLVNETFNTNISFGNDILFDFDDLNSYKLTIARSLIGCSLFALNFAWFLGALCIDFNVSNKSPDQANNNIKETTLLGLKNIYGSEYFLFILNAVMTIIIFNKPLAQLSIFLLCIQILSVLEILNLFNLTQNMIGPVVFGLLCYQQYFSTGHQATIPSIQWDSSFILTKEITFPFTHLSVFFNTFGAHIIISLGIALLTFWRQQPDVLNPQTLLARIVSNCGGLLIYHTILCLSSFIFVTHFRRHLMVWKIFCPRFIFASASLMVAQVIIVLVTISVASTKLIREVNELFWK